MKHRLSGQKFPSSTLEQTRYLTIYWRYFDITVATKAGIRYEPDVELFEFG